MDVPGPGFEPCHQYPASLSECSPGDATSPTPYHSRRSPAPNLCYQRIVKARHLDKRQHQHCFVSRAAHFQVTEDLSCCQTAGLGRLVERKQGRPRGMRRGLHGVVPVDCTGRARTQCGAPLFERFRPILKQFFTTFRPLFGVWPLFGWFGDRPHGALCSGCRPRYTSAREPHPHCGPGRPRPCADGLPPALH